MKKEKEEGWVYLNARRRNNTGMCIFTEYQYFDRGILSGEQRTIARLPRIDKVNLLALRGKHGMIWEEEA